MAENPLKQLKTATKGAAQKALDWVTDGAWPGRSIQTGKTDAVFKRHDLDTLRRAAYNSVFEALFLKIDEYPFSVPDKTLKKVIGKLASNTFPKGVVFSTADTITTDLLNDIIKQTKLSLKASAIVTEAALMGYTGLRSVFDDGLGRWLLEIKPKEYLCIEHAPGVPEEITAIAIEWPTVVEGKRYWNRERWTKETYEVWAPKPEVLGKRPEFKAEDVTVDINNYGEIPVTIVPHYFDPTCYGTGVVNEDEVLTVKALIRMHHKRHFGHLKYMDPNPVVKNRTNPGEAINTGIGKVIDIQQADESMPVDMTLLEYAGMPDSAKDEIYDHIRSLYDAAGLKAPPPDEVFKPGTDNSGIALRMLDKDDAKTIETLRDDGYSQVIRHLEKILRMGKNLARPGYEFVNPENDETWAIEAKYPDFFPPTDQDIGLKLANMNQAKLPASVMAPMVASLFGIEDAAVIADIQANLQEAADLLKPTPLNIGP